MLVLAGGVLLVVQSVHYLPEARHLPIEIQRLPLYAFYSFLRMLFAYIFSLFFGIVYGMVAGTSKRAERVMMPLLDILQSVPVIGFFPAAVFFFVNLTHGSHFGVEMASVFLIFTSQAWNLAFGVYEAVSTIPQDSYDALASQGVRGGLKLRLLYVPAAIPKLVYNSILSWAGGWYFLIACEIITVGKETSTLSGLGSFLMRASEDGHLGFVAAGVCTLIAIVVAMHFLLWRPLESWSEKFRYEFAASTVVAPTRMLRFWREFYPFLLVRRVAGAGIAVVREQIVKRRKPRDFVAHLEAPPPWWWRLAGYAVGVGSALFGVYVLVRAGVALVHVLRPPWPARARLIPAAIALSFLRLLIAYVVAIAWTVPVAVWAGNRPRVLRIVGPFAQIASSVPATVFFPLIAVTFIHRSGGPNIASVLLVLTGMQWYILFNLLAGVHAIPGDLREAVESLGLSRWRSFRVLIFPAMVPSLITGSITGWGGGWNALIVSEYGAFHGQTYSVLGIGALLQEAGDDPDQAMLVLSLVSMVLVIVLLNRFFWRRMYLRASDRFKIEY